VTLDVDGHRCALLQTHNGVDDRDVHYDYVVDLERQSAVTRRTKYVGDEPTGSYKVELQKVDGFWLPRSWTLVSIKGESAVRVIQMHVTRIKTNAPFDLRRYQVVPKAGDVVADASQN